MHSVVNEYDDDGNSSEPTEPNERVEPGPVGRMEDEAAAGLDRPAMMDRDVGRIARFDVELAQQAAKADSGALVADADPDGAVFIVDADAC